MRQAEPEDLKQFYSLSDTQTNPDGTVVTFTKASLNEKNKMVSQVWGIGVDGKNLRQLTQGEGGNGMARWSPDGTKIAFVSGRDKPAAQVFVLPMSGGEAQKLTNFPEGSIREYAWSPDGKSIAVAFRPTHPDRTAEAKKKREEAGLSTPPWELDSIWYRLDGDGFFGNQRFGLYIVNVADGTHSEIFTGGDADFFSFDWLPDSTGLAVRAPADKQSLLKLSNDVVSIISIKGKSKKLAGLPKGRKGMVAVSPDGKKVAWTGNENQSDVWGTRNEKVWVAGIDGSGCKCLSGGDDHCYEASSLTDTGGGGNPVLKWTPDSRALRVLVGWHGSSQIGELNASTGKLTLLTKGTQLVGPGNLDAKGECQPYAVATPSSLNEVAVLRAGKSKTLTDFSKTVFSGYALVAPEEVWIDSTDGTKLHAWVMRPTNKKGKLPVVIEVHGGPHTQYGTGYFHEFQCLVAQGYVVVFSNPRGSKGYGEAWCSAIERDWGGKDWEDIESLTKWVKSQPWADAQRIGIMGGSYGGFMTNWAVGHSKAYKAAITDRCVSNWVSMAGNSDFPLARDDYFGGHAWGDLQQIKEMWRQSPLAYFDKVTTPMLVIHSEGDFRCNVEQGEQVFHALQSQGVPSRFVRYPIETSHGMSRNGPADLRIHRLKEILAWWKKHL